MVSTAESPFAVSSLGEKTAEEPPNRLTGGRPVYHLSFQGCFQKRYFGRCPDVKKPFVQSQEPKYRSWMFLNLKSLWHYRYTGPPGSLPDKKFSHLELVGTQKTSLFKNSFSMLRYDNTLYREIDKAVSELLGTLDDDDFLKEAKYLLRALSEFGVGDKNRSQRPPPADKRDTVKQHSHQLRARIGIARGQFQPGKVTANGFLNKVEESSRYDKSRVLKILKRLLVFAWKMMQTLEIETTGVPLGCDAIRFSQFAKSMQEMFDPSEDLPDFNIEDITLVLSVLFPNFDVCAKHNDSKNDSRPGYSKTCVHNTFVLKISTRMVSFFRQPSSF